MLLKGDMPVTEKNTEILLEVKNLRVSFYTEGRMVPAVDDISFTINAGEIVGIVGESGCGKSVTSLSILRLVAEPPGKILPGSKVFFQGKDLLALSEKEMRSIRGNAVSMIFQEPMTSLNPVFKIGDQIGEVLTLHQGLSAREARRKCIALLKSVGISAPEKVIEAYPHFLSGGMRQRVMIAMALACKPKLLIADEPTTALDVTIQAQILDLMRKCKEETGASVLLITHNLGVVAETCQRVVVMYAGRIVEEADVYSLFDAPKHPYTQGLLNSVPTLEHKRARLDFISGVVPNPLFMPTGCRFAPRCSRAMPVCHEKEPALVPCGEKSKVRCFLHSDSVEGGEK